MRDRLNNVAFVGAGGIGMLSECVDFTNTYFLLISAVVFGIATIYKFDKVMSTGEYKVTTMYKWYVGIRNLVVRLRRKKNV